VSGIREIISLTATGVVLLDYQKNSYLNGMSGKPPDWRGGGYCSQTQVSANRGNLKKIKYALTLQS